MNKQQFLPHKLSGGESSSVILSQRGSNKFVVKHSVRNNLKNEFIALKLARKGKVPVPAVIKYKKGTLFLEYINGKNIKRPDLGDKFFKNLSLVLKKLHSIRTSRVGKLTSSKRFSKNNWFDFLKSNLTKNINFLVKNGKFSKTEGKSFIDSWVTKFHKLPNRTFLPTLVHNDIHLDNILVTQDKKLYLIDFEDSFYGDPLYDLVPFSDFHPRFFSQLKKFYNHKDIFLNGWQDWFRIYEFVHWVCLGAFYIDIGKQKAYQKYLTKILSFYQHK